MQIALLRTHTHTQHHQQHFRSTIYSPTIITHQYKPVGGLSGCWLQLLSSPSIFHRNPIDWLAAVHEQAAKVVKPMKLFPQFRRTVYKSYFCNSCCRMNKNSIVTVNKYQHSIFFLQTAARSLQQSQHKQWLVWLVSNYHSCTPLHCSVSEASVSPGSVCTCLRRKQPWH